MSKLEEYTEMQVKDYINHKDLTFDGQTAVLKDGLVWTCWVDPDGKKWKVSSSIEGTTVLDTDAIVAQAREEADEAEQAEFDLQQEANRQAELDYDAAEEAQYRWENGGEQDALEAMWDRQEQEDAIAEGTAETNFGATSSLNERRVPNHLNPLT